MTRPAPKAPLIDVNEAALRLGVSPRFVRRLVDERRIPFHKIGKFVRFDPADVDRYIVRGRVDAARS
jgi:excisionase family DNA binding protein